LKSPRRVRVRCDEREASGGRAELQHERRAVASHFFVHERPRWVPRVVFSRQLRGAQRSREVRGPRRRDCGRPGSAEFPSSRDVRRIIRFLREGRIQSGRSVAADDHRRAGPTAPSPTGPVQPTVKLSGVHRCRVPPARLIYRSNDRAARTELPTSDRRQYNRDGNRA